MKKIKLTFKADGTVVKELDGFSGSTCMTETEFIDKALGVVVETDLKHEYYLPDPVLIDNENKIVL